MLKDAAIKRCWRERSVESVSVSLVDYGKEELSGKHLLWQGRYQASEQRGRPAPLFGLLNHGEHWNLGGNQSTRHHLPNTFITSR